jgi:hypothetical protein
MLFVSFAYFVVSLFRNGEIHEKHEKRDLSNGAFHKVLPMPVGLK